MAFFWPTSHERQLELFYLIKLCLAIRGCGGVQNFHFRPVNSVSATCAMSAVWSAGFPRNR